MAIFPSRKGIKGPQKIEKLTHTMKILVADDHAIVRKGLKQSFWMNFPFGEIDALKKRLV